MWIRSHAIPVIGVTATVATLISGIGWAVPGLRAWLQGHGGLGWGLALLVTVLAAANWITTDEAVGKKDTELSRLADRIAELEQAGPRASTVPSQRDLSQFEELLAFWSWEQPPLSWLVGGFNAKRWESELSRPVLRFVEEWRERFFDDAETQSAFEDFYVEVTALTDWMVYNSFPDQHREGARYQVVPDGDERKGGWSEFDALRQQAIDIVQRLITARRELERTGRRRGL